MCMYIGANVKGCVSCVSVTCVCHVCMRVCVMCHVCMRGVCDQTLHILGHCECEGLCVMCVCLICPCVCVMCVCECV